MAAWSEHEDGPWVETRSALGQQVEEFGPKRTAKWLDGLNAGMNERLAEVSTPLPTPCPKCQRAMVDECPDCVDAEPFPTEVWTFFSDADLDQLVVDVVAEMGRRERSKQFVCGHHDCEPWGCLHDA